MNMTRGINLKKIADKLTGSSGAEIKAVCTEAGMYALRERRVHVTQEDFELAVAKVNGSDGEDLHSSHILFLSQFIGHEKGFRKEHVNQEIVEINFYTQVVQSAHFLT
jgi:SpoVK/Ycf46/Vps4 family AAA+-type ATPase